MGKIVTQLILEFNLERIEEDNQIGLDGLKGLFQRKWFFDSD